MQTSLTKASELIDKLAILDAEIHEEAEKVLLDLALAIMQDNPELEVFWLEYGSWGFEDEGYVNDDFDDFMNEWIDCFGFNERSLQLTRDGTVIVND